jgi:RNA recognition motif-containing protein
MFLNIQVPIVDLGKILSQSRLNTTYSNHQLQNHAHVHTQGIQQQQKKIYLKFREEKQIEKNVIKREREREREYGPMRASDPSPVPDPMNRRRFRAQGIDEAGGIFLCVASWLSPSLDPLYMAE